MNFDKLIAIFDADWDESKHPRAKNGQFGKGNGGSSAPAKEKKKSTMSKSYKALSSGQKADAKANVASQIKSMSKEKQISVANSVLKAQGKEPIVANKDGTYTWTNKGERVTTQKPPRIKSDKLARAIVSNGYAVPGIKTGVSATPSEPKAKAPSLKNPPKDGGGQTSTKLSKADQTKLAKRMSSAAQDVIEGQLQTYPDKDKNQVRNQYSYAANLLEDRLKSGKFNSVNEVLKDIEKSKPNSDYQAARQAAKMNGSGSDFRDYKEFTHTKLTPKLRKSLESKLDKAEENLYQRAQKEGRNLRPSETYQVASLVKGGLRMRMGTLNEIVGTIRKAPKTGARYADIAESLLKELHDIHK